MCRIVATIRDLSYITAAGRAVQTLALIKILCERKVLSPFLVASNRHRVHLGLRLDFTQWWEEVAWEEEVDQRLDSITAWALQMSVRCHRKDLEDYKNCGSVACFILALTSNQGEHCHISISLKAH